MRTAREWRPLPLLCKRLDVMDPYRGKKAPLEVAAPKQVRRLINICLGRDQVASSWQLRLARAETC